MTYDVRVEQGNNLRGMSCCGVKEITEVDAPPKAIINGIVDDIFGENGMDCAFLIFTDALREGNGRKFKNYILKNELGTVIESGRKENPNSGNNIRVWIWTPDMKKLKEIYKENDKKREKRFNLNACIDPVC